ncbi:MAG TPA: outer membrane lipid asymmetry maintenance protein MlaD, partial [Alphaproteobacteria bacterium]|nr:outer membrane lipid asymmetry maintenance protein MlaD [Alphaproteobacteria bacterium]
YELTARFDSISGLAPGSDVRVAGVKVGTVTGQELDPTTYLAVIRMNIADTIKLPRDTVAVVASESLLGGRYMQLQPGGDEALLKAGDRIEFTQSTPGIEQLLGQVIFSMQNSGKGEAAPAPGAAPAAPGAAAPGGGLFGTQPTSP